MPALPVAQLALPEFTTTARTRPPVERNAARPTSTGAATTRFFVNNAAALAPLATAELRSAWTGEAPVPTQARPHTFTSARSGRPLTLMPAATAAKENPRGKRTFSGELLRRSEVMPESSASFWAAAKLQTWAGFHGSSPLRRSDRAGDTYNSLCGSCREDPGARRE